MIEQLTQIPDLPPLIPDGLALKILKKIPDSILRDKTLDFMLAVDSRKVQENVARHYELARSADIVMFVVGCDDARADVPTGLHTLNGKKVVFQFIPVIGAGVPEESVLSTIMGEYEKNGVLKKNFMIVNAQHGSTDEIQHALKHHCSPAGTLTCGARKHRDDAELPITLQSHLKNDLGSSDIIENGEWVSNQIRLLLSSSHDEVPVYAAMMDHNKKIIYFTTKHPDFGQELHLPDCNTWEHSSQDPRVAVLAIGPQSISVPNGVILPKLVGGGYNNDFNAAASGERIDDVQVRLSELWYALNHSLQAKKNGEGDFLNLQALIVIADNQKYVHMVQEALLNSKIGQQLHDALEQLGGVRFLVLGEQGDQRKIYRLENLKPQRSSV
jgi:hypothetical protein